MVCKVQLSVYFSYLLISTFSSENIFSREGLFIFSPGKIVYAFHMRNIFYVFIMESLFIFFTKENCLCFSNLHVRRIKVK